MCREFCCILKIDKIHIVDGKCKQMESVELSALFGKGMGLNPLFLLLWLYINVRSIIIRQVRGARTEPILVYDLIVLLVFVWIGLAPEIPEDLYHLIKKAVAIRKHLERNRKDKDSKFRLILVESRIHRLARYYKKTKKLAPVWK